MADVESIKETSAYLAGDLAGQLADAAGAFTGDATALLKFHGVYQQDDRDVRKDRQRAGLDRAHAMMVRANIPGGVLTGEQYLVADRLADEIGNGTLRITTRQSLQWHLVPKQDLTTLIRTLNEHLITTIAACGDVVRNIVADSAPLPDRDDVLPHARELAVAVRPRTGAYWDLWVDGERAVSAVPPPDPEDPEPLYGTTYLPRKFKIAFAHTGDNATDIYTNDIGIVPARGDDGRIRGFTLLVGGGLGMTHNNAATFPRLADPLATIAPHELVEVVLAIVGVQRDHGDRDDRKHARLKYLVEDEGLAWFRAKVEARLGRALPPAEDLGWGDTSDHLGWHQQGDGRWFLGIPVPSGRIADRPGNRLRSALRALVATLNLEVRLTARQDLLLCGIPGDARAQVTDRLRGDGVALAEDLPPVSRHALACPALPTCGLALTEAERVLPDLTASFATELERLGIPDAPIHLRVTGCPNGCARPYSTEIGVVGRGKDRYTLHLGGNAEGTRLNRLVADRVHLDDLVPTLSPILVAWRDERRDGESFGDWCDRHGPESLTARYPAVVPPALVGS